jgi:hypothetical protein
MSKTAVLALALLAAAAAAPVPAAAAPGPPAVQDAAAVQPVSWDLWLAAKAKAEKHDAEGNLVAALQYYLEYARQARGLNSPVRVAWGLNNAAYMIIKMHRQDASVDLGPARRFLEEGMALEGCSEDCRKVMAMNLEHVRSCLDRAR